ncbi:hypothetical protein G6O69_02160 [Pseudenhygromyxa sp. WMMC2535]|uniref:hypothetical protein n=2 Tax=Pseudenhygromyxa sp. WMMC2535 TaxID=2712867 RepID=UPI001557AFA3|nr:hypothetical protein [Pseudenhygromyxa sp. WMMC2535]NVB36619.1 hypothetical protein [Pseudenhygromyxa sp. WMMC2535]
MRMPSPPRSLAFAFVSFVPLLTAGCVGFISEDGDESSDDEIDSTDSSDDPTSTDGSEGTTTGGGEETTIFDIQGGVITPETVVSVNGVVVTSPLYIDEDDQGGTVFVEDPAGGQYSGISLYLWSEVSAAANLQPGDVVNLVGRYQEFYDVSQLVIEDITDITVVDTGATIPGPDVVTAAEVARTSAGSEPWEGVRVQISDAVIDEANDGYGQYLLEGDALVGNLFTELPSVQAGGTFASITGPLHYTYGEFKVEPTSADDLAGYTAPADPTEDTEIYDIQMGSVSEDSLVKIEDVTVSAGLTWSDDSTATFFIQEPTGGAYSGIQVYVQDSAGLSIEPGDQVTVVGSYNEYYDMSQVTVSDASKVTVGGSGSAPSPEVVDPADVATGGAMAEDYEGVLIQVADVSVTNEDLGYGEFEVTGGLVVTDIFFDQDSWTLPALDDAYTSITGPLTYSYEVNKIAPRDASDLVAN